MYVLCSDGDDGDSYNNGQSDINGDGNAVDIVQSFIGLVGSKHVNISNSCFATR